MANIKTNIKATNYELTQDIRDHIDHQVTKFEKVLPTNADEIILDVEVGKSTKHHNQGPVFRAEFNIAYKGQLKRAEETQDDLKAALELAGDDLAAQIRKTKERRKDLIRRGAKKVKSWMRLGR